MVDIKIKNSTLESIILIIFFGILLFMGPANILDKKLVHDMPHGYYASDAFWHYIFSDTISETGNFKYYPYYYNGGFENVTAYNPGLFYQLSSIFSSLTNIEVFDSTIFLVYLLGILSIFTFYIIIKSYNKTIALFSLPLMILIFTKTFIVGFTFGLWLYIAASYFLILSFYIFTKIELDYSFILLALSLTAVINTHVPEFIFFFGFIILYFIVKLSTKKLRMLEIKKTFYALFLTIILSIYYLIIFKFLWMNRSPFKFEIKKFAEFSGSIFPKLVDFNYLLISIIIIGMVLALMFLLKENNSAIMVSFYMFAVGFTHWIGFQHRSLQNRYFWPIYFSIFFGIVIYAVFKKIVKEHQNILAFFIAFIILLIFPFSFYEKISSPGLMDPYHWEMFNYLSKETEKNSKVAYLWGDVFDQKAILLNSKRQSFFVIKEDYFQAINERKIKKEYSFDVITEQISPHRIGLFKFEYFKPPVGFHDICSFDYYVLDAIPESSHFSPAIQYNLLLRNELLKNNFIEEVFNNKATIILKNNNPGEDCLEPSNF